MKLREFVKIADTVYEVNAAALCDEDRLQYSRAVDFQVREFFTLRCGAFSRRVLHPSVPGVFIVVLIMPRQLACCLHLVQCSGQVSTILFEP